MQDISYSITGIALDFCVKEFKVPESLTKDLIHPVPICSKSECKYLEVDYDRLLEILQFFIDNLEHRHQKALTPPHHQK